MFKICFVFFLSPPHWWNTWFRKFSNTYKDNQQVDAGSPACCVRSAPLQTLTSQALQATISTIALLRTSRRSRCTCILMSLTRVGKINTWEAGWELTGTGQNQICPLQNSREILTFQSNITAVKSKEIYMVDCFPFCLLSWMNTSKMKPKEIFQVLLRSWNH